MIFSSSSLLGKGGEHEWIGDGFCDDINNNKFCNFDNGDCCGSNVKKHFCLNCTCIGMLPSYHHFYIYLFSNLLPKDLSLPANINKKVVVELKQIFSTYCTR